jgi:hypothetical protein
MSTRIVPNGRQAGFQRGDKRRNAFVKVVSEKTVFVNESNKLRCTVALAVFPFVKVTDHLQHRFKSAIGGGYSIFEFLVTIVLMCCHELIIDLLKDWCR